MGGTRERLPPSNCFRLHAAPRSACLRRCAAVDVAAFRVAAGRPRRTAHRSMDYSIECSDAARGQGWAAKGLIAASRRAARALALARCRVKHLLPRTRDALAGLRAEGTRARAGAPASGRVAQAAATLAVTAADRANLSTTARVVPEGGACASQGERRATRRGRKQLERPTPGNRNRQRFGQPIKRFVTHS